MTAKQELDHAYFIAAGSKEPDRGDSYEDDSPSPAIEWIHGEPDLVDDGIVDENVTDTDSAEARARRHRERLRGRSAADKLSDNLTVISAVIAGILVAAVKFAASTLTGSMAMFSEGVHSLVDATNDSLLLLGNHMARKEPDLRHPFGYGQLVYFYSFVVALVIFVAGGCFTIYQGSMGVIAGGHAIENPIINYIVLGVGIVLESISLSIAVRTVNAARGDTGIIDYIRESKSPTNITVFLEDSAAVLGMVIAFIGIFLSDVLEMPVIDAFASIVIGLIMATIAVILLRETRGLLVGEGLSPDELRDIVFIVEDDSAVIKCGRVLSLYLGPEDLLVNLDVTFDDEIDEGDVLQAVDRIEAEIMDEYPQTTRIFIEVESLNQVYRQRRDRALALKAENDEHD